MKHLRHPVARFYEFLDRPISGRARLVLAALVIPLVLSFTAPLWRIELQAPQYPKGLWMEIYAHKVTGGNDGQHLSEINTLNHYIGMAPINRAALTDLDWMPFAVGILALLALRAAAIGNVRTLIDLSVLVTYVFGFAMFRFWHKMYSYGHDLDPKAPLKVDPFTPALFGEKQVANFSTAAWPQLGAWLAGIFAAGVLLLTAWQLWSGRRQAIAAEEAATRATAPA